MERYKKSYDKNQLSIIPMCLDDMIPSDAEDVDYLTGKEVGARSNIYFG